MDENRNKLDFTVDPIHPNNFNTCENVIQQVIKQVSWIKLKQTYLEQKEKRENIKSSERSKNKLWEGLK